MPPRAQDLAKNPSNAQGSCDPLRLAVRSLDVKAPSLWSRTRMSPSGIAPAGHQHRQLNPSLSLATLVQSSLSTPLSSACALLSSSPSNGAQARCALSYSRRACSPPPSSSLLLQRTHAHPPIRPGNSCILHWFGHQRVVIGIKHFVAARLIRVDPEWGMHAVCHGCKAAPPLSGVSH